MTSFVAMLTHVHFVSLSISLSFFFSLSLRLSLLSLLAQVTLLIDVGLTTCIGATFGWIGLTDAGIVSDKSIITKWVCVSFSFVFVAILCAHTLCVVYLYFIGQTLCSHCVVFVT